MIVKNVEPKKLRNDVYWCNTCQIPLLTEHCYRCNSVGKLCGSNFRPMFRKERLFLEQKMKESLNKKIVLPFNIFSSMNRIIYRGKTLFRVRVENGHIEFENINLKYLNGDEIEDSEKIDYDEIIEAG